MGMAENGREEFSTFGSISLYLPMCMHQEYVGLGAGTLEYLPYWGRLRAEYLPYWGRLRAEYLPYWGRLRAEYLPYWGRLRAEYLPYWGRLRAEYLPYWGRLRAEYLPYWGLVACLVESRVWAGDAREMAPRSGAGACAR